MPFYRINRLFLFLFFCFNGAFSQNFPGKNYSAANQLPNNAVRSLLIDSQDILWVGTDNGVVRKENDVFKSYFEEDGLALNSCWAIAEDNNQNIWFGSYGGGVSIYDGTNFKVISENEGLIHNEITRLFPYKDYMLIGTSDGVSMVNIHTFKVFSLKLPPLDELFRITGFFEYQQQVYVTTYKSGLYKINGNSADAFLEEVNDHKYIYSVFADSDSIYSSNKGFYTKNTLEDYVNNDDSIASRSLGRSIIWDYKKTRADNTYAAAWGIYDTNGGIYEITTDRLISRGSDFNIPSKSVVSLAYDEKFDRLYAGTLDDGLFEVNLDPQIKFHAITGSEILGFAFFGNNSAVLMDDGVFLKNEKFQHRINLSQLKDWQQKYLAREELSLPDYEGSFYELDHTTAAEEIVFYDLKISEDIYWLNTNIGIFAINTAAELYRYIPLHSEEINFTEEGDLIETHPYGGVRIYQDLNTFNYEYFKEEDPDTPTMIVNSLRNGNKTYFLSVFSGLYVWENSQFRSYLVHGTWSEKRLRHITSLGKNIAISNEFGDVFILNDDGDFKILDKIPRAKIQGNTISFLKSYQDYLIIGTEKGLTIYKNNRFIFLDEEQGLKQPLLSAEVQKNTLAIGSNEGFYNINLEVITDPEVLVNQLNLKEIYVNNKNFPVGKTPGKERIDLAHDENTLLLKFSTNAHPFPHKLKYQYRLNTKDNWSFPSSRPEIFLPFLPANNYEVSIKVLDTSTGLSSTHALASLAIHPPYWKTWWFGLLILSLILIIVYGIYTYQIRQHKEFEEQKRLIQKRFEETKMEALLAQMNPHFIFNAMNSIQNYIMDSDIDNASIFLGDFAKLIRLNLDHCTKPTILLVEEIEYLRSYIRVENTRFNNAVRVEIEVDPAIDIYDVKIPTMILQTFVENVFVHAFPEGVNNPTLKVSFKKLAENLIQCRIEDNGIGISSSTNNKLHESRGVNLVRERLTMLGYNIKKAVKVISSKNKGTVIIINLEV